MCLLIFNRRFRNAFILPCNSSYRPVASCKLVLWLKSISQDNFTKHRCEKKPQVMQPTQKSMTRSYSVLQWGYESNWGRFSWNARLQKHGSTKTSVSNYIRSALSSFRLCMYYLSFLSCYKVHKVSIKLSMFIKKLKLFRLYCNLYTCM